jgi:hypothetical protein
MGWYTFKHSRFNCLGVLTLPCLFRFMMCLEMCMSLLGVWSVAIRICLRPTVSTYLYCLVK